MGLALRSLAGLALRHALSAGQSVVSAAGNRELGRGATKGATKGATEGATKGATEGVGPAMGRSDVIDPDRTESDTVGPVMAMNVLGDGGKLAAAPSVGLLEMPSTIVYCHDDGQRPFANAATYPEHMRCMKRARPVEAPPVPAANCRPAGRPGSRTCSPASVHELIWACSG